MEYQYILRTPQIPKVKKMMKTCQTYLPKKMASAYFSYRSEEASKLTWSASTTKYQVWIYA
jgi:hypothetical protein